MFLNFNLPLMTPAAAAKSNGTILAAIARNLKMNGIML